MTDRTMKKASAVMCDPKCRLHGGKCECKWQVYECPHFAHLRKTKQEEAVKWLLTTA